MNEDIVAQVICIIVMLAWGVHFLYYKPVIFSKSKRAILVWALCSVIIVSITMQVLYKLTMWIVSR